MVTDTLPAFTGDPIAIPRRKPGFSFGINIESLQKLEFIKGGILSIISGIMQFLQSRRADEEYKLQAYSRESAALYEEGVRAFEQLNYTECCSRMSRAIQLYDNAYVSASPDDSIKMQHANTCFMNGLVYLYASNVRQAHAYIKRAVRSDGAPLSYALVASITAYLKGDAREAEELITTRIKAEIQLGNKSLIQSFEKFLSALLKNDYAVAFSRFKQFSQELTDRPDEDLQKMMFDRVVILRLLAFAAKQADAHYFNATEGGFAEQISPQTSQQKQRIACLQFIIQATSIVVELGGIVERESVEIRLNALREFRRVTEFQFQYQRTLPYVGEFEAQLFSLLMEQPAYYIQPDNKHLLVKKDVTDPQQLLSSQTFVQSDFAMALFELKPSVDIDKVFERFYADSNSKKLPEVFVTLLIQAYMRSMVTVPTPVRDVYKQYIALLTNADQSETAQQQMRSAYQSLYGKIMDVPEYCQALISEGCVTGLDFWLNNPLSLSLENQLKLLNWLCQFGLEITIHFEDKDSVVRTDGYRSKKNTIHLGYDAGQNNFRHLSVVKSITDVLTMMLRQDASILRISHSHDIVEKRSTLKHSLFFYGLALIAMERFDLSFFRFQEFSNLVQACVWRECPDLAARYNSMHTDADSCVWTTAAYLYCYFSQTLVSMKYDGFKENNIERDLRQLKGSLASFNLDVNFIKDRGVKGKNIYYVSDCFARIEELQFACSHLKMKLACLFTNIEILIKLINRTNSAMPSYCRYKKLLPALQEFRQCLSVYTTNLLPSVYAELEKMLAVYKSGYKSTAELNQQLQQASQRLKTSLTTFGCMVKRPQLEQYHYALGAS